MSCRLSIGSIKVISPSSSFNNIISQLAVLDHLLWDSDGNYTGQVAVGNLVTIYSDIYLF